MNIPRLSFHPNPRHTDINSSINWSVNQLRKTLVSRVEGCSGSSAAVTALPYSSQNLVFRARPVLDKIRARTWWAAAIWGQQLSWFPIKGAQ